MEGKRTLKGFLLESVLGVEIRLKETEHKQVLINQAC